MSAEADAGCAVRHAAWGDGVVMKVENDRIIVFFDEHGYRTLSLPALAHSTVLRARPRS
ncbi:hypothetical protein [Rhodococcus sp. USK13]|uniref:hypothetical protein n=1 Tax=Rhodococcus sp. USK13 TaxID=2806442 RepID=UPI001BCC6B20|nr:hypothetical protein [Rhodococcus sp. USK13]